MSNDMDEAANSQTRNEQFADEVRARKATPDTKSAGEPLQFQRKARPERLQGAASVRRIFWYTAPAGTTIDAVLNPDYWQPIHRQLLALDRIEVYEETGSFFAELIVLSVGADGARVAGLRGVELHNQVGVRGAALRNNVGGEIHYRGPHKKWTVEISGNVLQEGLASEAEAQQWLGSYVRTMNR